MSTSALVPTALQLPVTTLGVDRRAFYFNLGLAAFLGVGARLWWLLLLNLWVHLLLMWLTHRHPDLVAVYMQYRSQGDFYRPWGEPKLRNRRPEGYGRGMPGA